MEYKPAFFQNVSAGGIFHSVAGTDFHSTQINFCKSNHLLRRLGGVAFAPALMPQVVADTPLLTVSFPIDAARADEFTACLFHKAEVVIRIGTVVNAS